MKGNCTVGKKFTYEDIKKRKRPVFQKVPIALDSEKADEFNELRAEVDRLTESLEDDKHNKKLAGELYVVKSRLDTLFEQMKDEVVVFVFRSIGRVRYEELVNANPPTKKQQQEALKKGDDELHWNPETFPPSLVAAALVSPELTEEQVFEIWEDESWNESELLALFMAAFNVNQMRKIVDLGKEYGGTTV